MANKTDNKKKRTYDGLTIRDWVISFLYTGVAGFGCLMVAGGILNLEVFTAIGGTVIAGIPTYILRKLGFFRYIADKIDDLEIK